jgi:hypothetical protein
MNSTCECGAKLVPYTSPSGAINYICANTLARYRTLYGGVDNSR